MSDAIAFQDRVQDALAAIPGVTGVSAATALPLTATAPLQTPIRIPGAPGNTGDAERDSVLADIVGVARELRRSHGHAARRGPHLHRVAPELAWTKP